MALFCQMPLFMASLMQAAERCCSVLHACLRTSHLSEWYVTASTDCVEGDQADIKHIAQALWRLQMSVALSRQHLTR